MTGEPERGRVRSVLGNRRLVLVLVAYACSAVAEWAVWVAVLVYAYERGGSSTAGIASIALLVPAAVVAPWAGRAADGPRPNRVLVVVYSVQAAATAAAAVLARTESPAVVVVVAASIAITGVTFVRPAVSVVVPGLVVTPSDLVAANLLIGNADSVSVLAGPLLASALLASSGPAAVFAACVVLGVVGAAATLPLARLRPPPGPVPAPRSHRGRARDLLTMTRSMSHQRGSVELLVVLGGQYALIGGLDLLSINLAFRVLDLDASGPGLLNAAFGVGAVLGGVGSMLVVGRRRLAPTMVVALASIALAMVVAGTWTTAAVVLVMLPIAGISRSLLDVTGRMLLQRSAPQDVLASVFAVLEVLAGVGILCGSLVVQIVVGVAGVRPAVFAVAGLFVVLCVATAPGLRHADEHADAPVVEIRLLRGVPLFAPLPGPELEGLARSSTMVRVAAGDVVVGEGEVGDRYYVIADGQVEVTIEGRPLRTMARGEAFGEIALLADLPRTATVTATTPTSLLAVDRVNFLSAVVGHDASSRVAWAVARSLHPPLSTDDA